MPLNLSSLTPEAQVAAIYIGYFDRAPDPYGADFWEGAVANQGVSLSDIAMYFSFQEETYAEHPFFVNPSATAANAFISELYVNLFNRVPDAAGLNFWSDVLQDAIAGTGSMSVGQIVLEIIQGAQGADLTIIENKIAVATAWTEAAAEAGLEGSNAFGDSASAQASAKSILDGVTANTTTVDAAKTTLETAFDDVSVGQTFMLTTGADSGPDFVGSANDDNFVATNTTLTAGDNLVGSAGADTLTLTITESGANLNIAGVVSAGIETIDVKNFTTTNDETINLSQFTGVADIKVTGSTEVANEADTFFTNVGSIVNAEMSDGGGNLSITYDAAAVEGTADEMTLTLGGQTAGTFTLNASAGGVETLNVVSGTSANTVDITDDTNVLESVVVSGDQDLETTVTSDALTSVNAGDMSGVLDLTTDEATNMSITAGAGDDTVTFAGDNFDANDTVDGGDGDDTLEIASTIAAATALANVSNIEVLSTSEEVTLAADTNVSVFDMTGNASADLNLNAGYEQATTVTLNGTANVINNANVALTVNVTDAQVNGSDSVITGGTGTDTVNVTATGDGTGVDMGQMTNVDSIVVVDGGDDAAGGDNPAGDDITITTGAYATALTIDASALDTGTADADEDGKFGDDATAERLTVDGALATAALTITGGAADDTITTGTVNDVVDGGAGNDTITSTGGDDNLSGGAGDDTFEMSANLTTDDTIDGGDGDDTLNVSSVDADALTNVTNVETLGLTGASTATLSSNLSFTAIDMATADNVAQSITLADGYTNAMTVDVDAGDTVVNNADVALTVNATDAGLNGTTVTGSSTTTNDSINITAASEGGTAVDLSSSAGNVTNVNTVTIVDGGDGDDAGDDITINVENYATALTIDASALDAATVDSNADGDLSDEAANETLTITGTSEQSLTVTGGAAADTILGSDDAADGDNLAGGAGDDTFTMAGNLTGDDTIDGGAGDDTMSISGGSQDLNFLDVSSIETLEVAGTSTYTLDTRAEAAGVRTITGDTADTTVNAAGFSAGLTFATGTGDDTLTSGFGDDTFSFVDSELTAADVIDGGDGSDAIEIINDADADETGDATSATIDAISNVETVTVVDKATDNAAGDVTITMANGTYDQASLTIDGSALDAGETLTFDASSMSDDDEVFNVTGGAGDDTLTGGAGADAISGGAGADVIKGGVGADELTGGAGADTFEFDEGDSTSAKTTTITDFTADSDKLTINLVAGGDVNAVDGGDATSIANGLTLLSSKEGEYFFNTADNQLVMDLDGNGLIQATDMIINMTDETGIDSSDVDMVIDATGGNYSVATGAGDDIIDQGDAATLTTAEVIAAGAGDDELKLTADNDGTGAIVDDMTGVETITIVESATATDNVKVTLSYTAANTDALTITAAALADTGAVFTLDASDAEVEGDLTVTGGAGADSITTGAGADTVTGGTGADTITGGAGADELTGGAGTDIFIIAAPEDHATGEDIDGGADTDTIRFTSTTDDEKLTVNSGVTVEVIEISDAAGDNSGTKNVDLDASAMDAAEDVELIGNAGDNEITGNGGDNLYTVTAGNDVVDLKDGDDTAVFTEALFINNSETTATHNGGAGANTIQLEASSINIVDADFARLTNFQTLDLVSGTNNVTLGTAAATTGITTVDAGTGADTITLGAGDLTIALGDTDDESIDTIVLTKASGTKIVTGFVSAEDTVDLGGDIKTALSGDSTEVAGDVSANNGDGESYDIEAAATGIVDEDNNGTLLASDLSDLSKVATAITGAFDFSDAGNDADANLEVFAVESDTTGTFGIYGWTQSSAGDTTVGADEIAILGIVTGDDLAAADLDIA